MGSAFNPQILVEKLVKLNSSQASIETLSHWCIFHMNKAKQVVETWAKQFHCAPREKRVAFLYLANDILQNSRRKGSEFVGDFWKVLPDALRDVIQNGDENARNSALRLIGIWEERKVFGSRGQILKEEFVRRHGENDNRDVKPTNKPTNVKLRPPVGNALEKIASGYHHVYGGLTDEDAVLSKCRNAISCLEKAEKEIGHDNHSGQFHGSAIVEELQGHNAILNDCIEQLTAIESSRASLVSHLREALQDQEFKLGQVRSQIQAARVQSEQTSNTCRQVLNGNSIQSLAEQSSKEIQTSMTPATFIPGDREQSAPLMYAPQQVTFSQNAGHIEEDPRKSAAAAVAAKLAASTSSAQMLSYVLSSLASEGVIGNPMTESSAEYHSEKRAKLDNDQSSYVQSQNSQQPLPPYSLSEPSQHNAPTSNHQSAPNEPPPPPSSSPPPLPPLPPLPQQYPVPQFMQTAGGSINNMAYSYGMSQQPPMAAYPAVGVSMNNVSPYTTPMNTYQGFQGSDGNYYNQPSSTPMLPMSRQ